MLLPYATNCYHDGPPRGTIALILANVLVFASVQRGWIAVEESMFIWSSWNPIGWLRGAFLHAEWGHIIGNVIGLWVFGQVLEGAVGTRAFLIMCLAFVLGSGFVGTLAFHAFEGGAYGASGVVYATFIAACLAAPRTKIRVLFWFFIKPRWIAVRVTLLGAMFLALELMQCILFVVRDTAIDLAAETGSFASQRAETPMLLSTPGLHLISAAIGAGVAYVGLKLNWLDAGGWDLFSKGHKERVERENQRLGDFVMPASNSAIPEPRVEVPNCEHCGRVRPAHKLRCTYCGLA